MRTFTIVGPSLKYVYVGRRAAVGHKHGYSVICAAYQPIYTSEINFKSSFLRDADARRDVKFNYAAQASIGHVEVAKGLCVNDFTYRVFQ